MSEEPKKKTWRDLNPLDSKRKRMLLNEAINNMKNQKADLLKSIFELDTLISALITERDIN